MGSSVGSSLLPAATPLSIVATKDVGPVRPSVHANCNMTNKSWLLHQLRVGASPYGLNR